MNYLDLFDLEEKIQIMDVGAAAISEIPVYKKLMEIGIGKLNAFEGDRRHSAKLKEEYGIIMGVQHKKFNIHGVQFHPESIKTKFGMKILKNFINN